MKIYMCNKKKCSWYEKVIWQRVIIYFIISFFAVFSLLYFLLGNNSNFIRALLTSIGISSLISFGVVIHYVIDNRINIYVVKNNKMYVMFPHGFSREYEDSLISYEDFEKIVKEADNVKDIIKNPDKYKGIDVFEVTSIDSHRVYKKMIKFKSKGIFYEWHSEGGFFTISDYRLEKKTAKKDFLITCDYDGYSELLRKLNSEL